MPSSQLFIIVLLFALWSWLIGSLMAAIPPVPCGFDYCDSGKWFCNNDEEICVECQYIHNYCRNNMNDTNCLMYECNKNTIEKVEKIQADYECLKYITIGLTCISGLVVVILSLSLCYIKRRCIKTFITNVLSKGKSKKQESNEESGERGMNDTSSTDDVPTQPVDSSSSNVSMDKIVPQQTEQDPFLPAAEHKPEDLPTGTFPNQNKEANDDEDNKLINQDISLNNNAPRNMKRQVWLLVWNPCNQMDQSEKQKKTEQKPFVECIRRKT